MKAVLKYKITRDKDNLIIENKGKKMTVELFSSDFFNKLNQYQKVRSKTINQMTQKQHLTIKWIVLSLLIIIAVLVMYYQHRPIKEVPKNEFPVYSPYKNY